jgi:hypothetical protein
MNPRCCSDTLHPSIPAKLWPLLNFGREVWRSQPIQYREFSRLQEHGLRSSEVFLVVFLGHLFLVMDVSRSNIMNLAPCWSTKLHEFPKSHSPKR